MDPSVSGATLTALLEAVLLRWFEGRTVDDIARLTGRSASAVRRLLGRAQLALGRLLAEAR